MIHCHMNDHCIGLHGQIGTRFEHQLNGSPEEFIFESLMHTTNDYEWRTVSDLIDIIKASIHHSYLPNKENYTVAFDHTGGGCWSIAISGKDGSQYLIGADGEPFDRDDLDEPLKFNYGYEPAFGIERQYGPDGESDPCYQCEHCTKRVSVNHIPADGLMLNHEQLEGAIITKLIGAIFDLLTDYQECEEQ